MQQKTKDTESRTIGHTGGDLLTYRVDGLLPRYPLSLNKKQVFNKSMMATFKFIFRSDVQFNVVATNAVGASPAGPNSPIYSVIGKRLMHLFH